MKSAPAGQHPRLHHLKDFGTPIGPSPSCGRIILSESGKGDCAVPPAGVSIKYVLTGEEHYETPRGTAFVRAGEFAVVGPGIPLTAILPRSETTIGLCIYLPEQGPRLLPVEGQEEFGVFRGGNAGFAPLLEQVASRLAHRPQLGAPAVGALLKQGAAGAQLPHALGGRAGYSQATKKATREELVAQMESGAGVFAQTMRGSP